MSRRVPVQKRSRERVEQVLEATGELIASRGAEELSMRSLADASEMSVATIYQYFENREEVIAAFLELQMEKLDIATAESLLALERVTLRALLETIGSVHMEYHRSHPGAVNLWFSGRAGYLVADRIRAQNASLGAWLRKGVVSSGLLTDAAPSFGAGLVIRQFDRTFEFIFLEPRSTEEQDEIIAVHIENMARFLEQWAGPNNEEGVSVEEFLIALGPPPEYVAEVS